MWSSHRIDIGTRAGMLPTRWTNFGSLFYLLRHRRSGEKRPGRPGDRFGAVWKKKSARPLANNPVANRALTIEPRFASRHRVNGTGAKNATEPGSPVPWLSRNSLCPGIPPASAHSLTGLAQSLVENNKSDCDGRYYELASTQSPPPPALRFSSQLPFAWLRFSGTGSGSCRTGGCWRSDSGDGFASGDLVFTANDWVIKSTLASSELQVRFLLSDRLFIVQFARIHLREVQDPVSFPGDGMHHRWIFERVDESRFGISQERGPPSTCLSPVIPPARLFNRVQPLNPIIPLDGYDEFSGVFP